jgi:type II secretory pathway component PulC
MRSLWLLNLLLGLVALILLEGIVSVALDRPSMIFTASVPATPAPRAPSAQRAEAVEPAAAPAQVPPLSDFAAIAEKDLFRNPNPEPVPPTRPGVTAAPPPQTPLPALIGTLFVGEERKAILKEGNRTESYSVGQSVGGGKLVRIESDRVLIERGGTEAEVLLRASIQSASPSAPGGRGPTRPMPRPVVPHGTPPPDASTAPDGGSEAVSEVDPGASGEPGVQTGPGGQAAQEAMTPEERLRRLRQSFQERKYRTRAR